MAAWPKLPEVRTFLRLQPNDVDDLVIDTARLAAIDFGNRRTNYKWDPNVDPDVVIPDTVHQACLMHAARLYRRRDSVDGTIGYGEMGVIRVGRLDGDITSLYDSVGPVVFG